MFDQLLYNRLSQSQDDDLDSGSYYQPSEHRSSARNRIANHQLTEADESMWDALRDVGSTSHTHTQGRLVSYAEPMVERLVNQIGDNYVKLDDTVPLSPIGNVKLVSKEFRQCLIHEGLADISDPDNQRIITIADSIIYRLSKELAKQKAICDKLISIDNTKNNVERTRLERLLKETRAENEALENRIKELSERLAVIYANSAAVTKQVGTLI